MQFPALPVPSLPASVLLEYLNFRANFLPPVFPQTRFFFFSFDPIAKKWRSFISRSSSSPSSYAPSSWQAIWSLSLPPSLKAPTKETSPISHSAGFFSFLSGGSPRRLFERLTHSEFPNRGERKFRCGLKSTLLRPGSLDRTSGGLRMRNSFPLPPLF